MPVWTFLMGIFMTTTKKENPLGHVFPKTKVTFNKYVGEREGDWLIFCSHRPHNSIQRSRGAPGSGEPLGFRVKKKPYLKGAGFEPKT